MIISKEKFVEILKFMREQSIKQDKFITVLEELSPNSYCDCFLFSAYENKLIDLLMIMLDDTDEDISYFLYELNWINKEEVESSVKEGDKLLYNSPETLYDYLINKMNK